MGGWLVRGSSLKNKLTKSGVDQHSPIFSLGVGKTHVIECVTQLLEREFWQSGDDPNCPYILKLAFTGNAASIIGGQTVHSAFQLPFGNKNISLSDKLRDLRRKQLKNLKLIILDEMSLIKADMLYQIHFRLTEGVSMLLLGNIMKIKPPMGTMIYASPMNGKSKALYQMPGGNLWQKFETICLKTNHRQGESGIYANLLNRVRTGDHTKEDIDILKTRVFPRDSPLIPKESLLITGENRIVNEVNVKKINELEGELFEIKAIVHSKTRGKFKPAIDKAGQIKNTTLQKTLSLKRRARVMLTNNIDVCDNLSNGQLGEVVDIITNEKGQVEKVMVEFDNTNVGQEHRKRYDFSRRYPGRNITCIKKVEMEYRLKEESASSATATNFPLKLAWATSCHKIQASTGYIKHKLLLSEHKFLDC